MPHRNTKRALVMLDEIFSLTPEFSEVQQASLLRQVESHGEVAGRGQNGLGLHKDGTFSRVEHDDVLKDAVFVGDVTITDCFIARFGENLTAAERELLKELLCGGSLRDASARDGRTYETKRNQLAALRSKAGVGTQMELVQIMAVLLTQMNLQNNAMWDAHARRLQEFAHRHYQHHARIHKTAFPNGRALHVLDLGPIGGKPCVFMHPSLSPFVPLPNQTDFLTEANIRVIIPIRPGFYGARGADQAPEIAMSHFVDDCTAFMRTFDLDDAPIISATAGVVSAIRIAEKLGTKSGDLLILSPQYFPRTVPGNSSAFANGWHSLATHFRDFIVPTFSVLASQMLVPSVYKHMISKAYIDSQADHDFGLKLVEYSWAYDMRRDMGELNMAGMSMDLQLLSQDWPSRLSGLQCKVTVLYGETDPYSHHDLIAERLRSLGANVQVLPGFGQSTIFAKPAVLFKHVFGDGTALGVHFDGKAGTPDS